jgi:hypothetical protein
MVPDALFQDRGIVGALDIFQRLRRRRIDVRLRNVRQRADEVVVIDGEQQAALQRFRSVSYHFSPGAKRKTAGAAEREPAGPLP